MKNLRLRNAVALGTSFTALFLVVNCTVTQRDYEDLGIGTNAGSGGSAGDDDSENDAGLGGSGPAGDVPLAPVPCYEDAGTGTSHTGGGLTSNADAGNTDGGTGDAGTGDAGSTDSDRADAGPASPCACVDGFYRAVDADGDGEGTRACTIAPGRDCDDGDPAVTHNGCGGCSALPSELGSDCLDCGSYVCDGTDNVACASKPGPVEDPDCRCEQALLVPRDIDQDGEGTRLCEANPGLDCNDGDETFIANECGGCEPLPGAVGDPCNVCGVYTCNGTALVCAPQTGTAGRRCVGNTSQTCVGTGFWGEDTICPNVCYPGTGRCEVCTPGKFMCSPLGNGSTQVLLCASSSYAGGITWVSYTSCSVGQTCNANNGTCTGSLLWPRDLDFDLVPRLEGGGLRWHELLNTASDSDYG